MKSTHTLLNILLFFILGACATLPATELATESVSTAPPVKPFATEPSTSPEAIPPVAQLAIEALAAQSGIPVESITVQTIEDVDWPNGCLGIDYKDTACTDAIVPGFRIILQANGQSYEYRSNQDGSLLMPAAPIPATPDNKITQIARTALAQQLGISEDAITILSQEEVDWPDGCLGINLTEMACMAVITPGFRIILQANGQTYEYHSNQDGSQMLLATSVPATGEIPALLLSVKGGIAGFCDEVSLFLSGLATFRSCNFAQETRYQLTPVQLQTLQTLASAYGPFEYTQADPAVADQMTVQIIFNGQGNNQPTLEIYQQLQTLGMEVMNAARGISPDTTAQYLPLAGLIYTTGSGLWQFGSDGAPKQLSATQEARLSPDGQHLLTWDGNDLFLTALATGETRNLTNTSTRIEYPPQAGGFFADKIFFTSYPDTAEGAPGFTGYLTVINPDGTGYTILDEENNAGLYAVSPDEHTVAYGSGQTTWLYHLDTGTREIFNPTDYSVTDVAFLSSPSWSPNGEMLAWIVSGNFGGQEQFALAVFDLKGKVGAIFHPHQLSGLGGFPPGGVWSPDGSYIALNTFDMEKGQPDAWVIPVVPLFNRRPEFHLEGGNPIWSPDGKYLVVVNSEDGNLLLTDTTTWNTTSIQAPDTIFNLLDW